jgi:hypothetical protein
MALFEGFADDLANGIEAASLAMIMVISKDIKHRFSPKVALKTDGKYSIINL